MSAEHISKKEQRQQATGPERLRLSKGGDALGVGDEWKSVLAEAVPDPKVGIRIAQIDGGAQYGVYVAAIPKQVGCHFHDRVGEKYEVTAGQGRLHWGKVERGGDTLRVAWEESVDVKKGDRFLIPEGYAHQLEKTGDQDLTIVFSCPGSHLDETNRTMLPDAPGLAPAA